MAELFSKKWWQELMADIAKAAVIAVLGLMGGFLLNQVNLITPLWNILSEKMFILSILDVVVIILVIYFIIEKIKIKDRIKVMTSTPLFTGKMNQGESVPIGSLRLSLEDLSNEAGDLYVGLSLNTVEKDGIRIIDHYKISEGGSETIKLQGHTVIINVGKIMPGFTFGAKWAEIKIWVIENT
jgi:hypothetical protein